MILATAGHVDHGKTSLVRALTGVDTDRLPEEKRRGLTIDLGFAYMPVADGVTIGFVDVPGHERFIHNMLSGLAGIDAVLLTVAADDGAKPQTLEHLAILDLLQVAAGALVITKIDRVTPARVADVAGEMQQLLGVTRLAGVRVFPVSAHTGAGLAELKQYLAAAARAQPLRPVQGNFRLAVDRAFSLPGAGSVVTGTALSGQLRTGEAVHACLAGIAARARMIHAQNSQSEIARAGHRCAINLAGADLRDHPIRRGDWIVAPPGAEPVRRFDATLLLHRSCARPLAHWTPVHVHLGAADVTGRVALLDRQTLAPGESGFAQLVLDRPLAPVCGDRFIVRDQSARATLGGGSVLDIFPPARGRGKPERRAELAMHARTDAASALPGLLEQMREGVVLERFAVNRNMTGAEAAQLFGQVPMKRVPPAGAAQGTGVQARGFSTAHWEDLRRDARAAVQRGAAAGARGLPAEEVLSMSTVRLPREAVLMIADELVREGTLRRDAGGLHMGGEQQAIRLSAPALWAKVDKVLQAGGTRPPTVNEIAEQIREPVKAVESVLKEAAHYKLALRVSQTRYFTAAAVERLARLAHELGSEGDHRITAAAFRDRAGVGRNVSIEVLEFFDRVKYTRRLGDARVLLRQPGEVAEFAPPRSS